MTASEESSDKQTPPRPDADAGKAPAAEPLDFKLTVLSLLREVFSHPAKSMSAIVALFLATVFGVFVFPGNAKLSDALVSVLLRTERAHVQPAASPPPAPVAAVSAAPMPVALPAVAAAAPAIEPPQPPAPPPPIRQRSGWLKMPYASVAQCAEQGDGLAADSGFSRNGALNAAFGTQYTRGGLTLSLRCVMHAPMAILYVMVAGFNDDEALEAVNTFIRQMQPRQLRAQDKLSGDLDLDAYGREDARFSWTITPWRRTQRDCVERHAERLRSNGFATRTNDQMTWGRKPALIVYIACTGDRDRGVAAYNVVSLPDYQGHHADHKPVLDALRIGN